MKKGAVSVRFSDELNATVKRIAGLYDVTDVAVVRWAVKALGAYHAIHGQLPPLEITDAPLILHEPPRTRPAQARAAGSSKTKTGARYPSVPALIHKND